MRVGSGWEGGGSCCLFDADYKTFPQDKIKTKSFLFFSFFLSFSLYAKRVRSFPLSDSSFFSYPFLLFSCQTPPVFFLPFLTFYPRFHSFDYGCDWLFLGYRHFLFSSSPHLYLFFFFLLMNRIYGKNRVYRGREFSYFGYFNDPTFYFFLSFKLNFCLLEGGNNLMFMFSHEFIKKL